MKKVVIICYSLLLTFNFDAAAIETGAFSDGLEIRVRNVSDAKFNKTRITFLGQIESYGVLGPGEYSSYHKIEKAYRYASVIVLSQDKLFLAMPIDYVGEEPLEPGKYTYELKVRLEEREIEVNGIVYHGYVDIVLKRDAGDT